MFVIIICSYIFIHGGLRISSYSFIMYIDIYIERERDIHVIGIYIYIYIIFIHGGLHPAAALREGVQGEQLQLHLHK